MQDILNEALHCEKCALCRERKNVVFGRGNERAKLVFVGEAPGAKEDESGLPFVGAAGKLLDRALSEVGILPEEYYVANIVKCRPPENRDPTSAEALACLPYLERQIEKIDPEYVVCLGRIAAMRLIRKDFRITSEHGKVFLRGKRRILAVLHPAAILRDVRKKEEWLLDFQKIRRLLEEEP